MDNEDFQKKLTDSTQQYESVNEWAIRAGASLLTLAYRPDMVDSHPEAVKGFVQDLAARMPTQLLMVCTMAIGSASDYLEKAQKMGFTIGENGELIPPSVPDSPDEGIGFHG